MISAFPKIFTIGQDYIRDIFKDDVEITEKIDGSQCVFGKVNGELYARSKGKQFIIDAPEKMFLIAVTYIQSIEPIIPDNTVYYCEYLSNPKHNTLKYDRVPKNNLILFGVSTPSGTFVSKYDSLKEYADEIFIETVPLIFYGRITSSDALINMLERTSVLGGSNIEGVVIKNYKRPFLLGGQPIPLMSGKFVSEKFKETNRTRWAKEETGKGRFAAFCDSFNTEARWEKAIQRLRDDGELENSPRDIGKLIPAIQNDITEEEIEDIKNYLWNENKRVILGSAIKGFPEFYKKKLAENSFL